jgi:hypothetical protein
MGFFSKIKKALKFAFSHGKSIIKGMFKNPARFLTGPGILGTKIHNTLFGTKYKPLINTFGGATEQQFQDYEAKHGPGSLGFARTFQTIADTVAGFYAGGGLTKLGSKAVGAVTSKVGSAATTGAGGTGSAAGTTAGEAMPEIVVNATRSGSTPVAGITGGGSSSFVAQPPTGPHPLSIPYPSDQAGGGFLSRVWQGVTSENGLQLLGGALQGYQADQQQRRAIDEQRRYSRAFTPEELASITGGMNVPAPRFLENARRVRDYLDGRPSVGAPTMTPEQTAALARSGG